MGYSVFDLVPSGPTAEPFERRNPPVGNPARDDQVEMAEVSGVVQRKPVAGDPTRDADTNRGKLFLAYPYACETADAPGLYPKIGRDADEHLLQIANVAVNVAPVGLQVDDGIADDLPGAVVGDVAAAAGFEDVDPTRGERFRRREDVRSAAITANAECEHRRMLEQEKLIRSTVRAPLLDELALQGQSFAIGNEAEATDFEGSHELAAEHAEIAESFKGSKPGQSLIDDSSQIQPNAHGAHRHNDGHEDKDVNERLSHCDHRYTWFGSQFSSECLTCDMNSSATAPSMIRWSYPSDKYAMCRMPMASSITTGRFSIAPTPRMATCG